MSDKLKKGILEKFEKAKNSASKSLPFISWHPQEAQTEGEPRIDMYDPSGCNNNGFVVGKGNTGKSFFAKHLIANSLSHGHFTRIVDTAGTYRDLCHNLGGKYIEIDEGSYICRNPFYDVTDYDREYHISNDRLVVFDLKAILNKKGLFDLTVCRVLNYVIKEPEAFFPSQSKRRTLIVLDEMYQLLKEGDYIVEMVRQFERHCRCYGAGLLKIAQNIDDLRMLGTRGGPLLPNSAFRFYFQQDDNVGKATSDSLGVDIDLLKNIRSDLPAYSEMYAQTPRFAGCIRLTVPPSLQELYCSQLPRR